MQERGCAGQAAKSAQHAQNNVSSYAPLSVQLHRSTRRRCCQACSIAPTSLSYQAFVNNGSLVSLLFLKSFIGDPRFDLTLALTRHPGVSFIISLKSLSWYCGKQPVTLSCCYCPPPTPSVNQTRLGDGMGSDVALSRVGSTPLFLFRAAQSFTIYAHYFLTPRYMNLNRSSCFKFRQWVRLHDRVGLVRRSIRTE